MIMLELQQEFNIHNRPYFMQHNNHLSQAERKIWFWKHNSNKQNWKDSLKTILYLITKTDFKSNQEKPRKMD